MGNSYEEVFRTYRIRPFSSGMAALSTVCTIPFLIIATCVPPTYGGLLTTAMIFLVYLEAGIWRHFAEQMVSEQRILRPNFVRPHLLAFIVISSLLVIIWPATLLFLHGTRSLGFMAMMTAAFAVVGWVTLNGWVILGVVGWCMYLWLMNADPSPTFLTGQHEPLVRFVLAASLVAIGIAVARMTKLTEDDPTWGKIRRFENARRRQGTTGDINQGWTEEGQNGFLDSIRLPRRPFVPSGTSIWARARRWQWLASRGSRGNSAWAIFAMCMFLGPALSGHELAGSMALSIGFLPFIWVVGAWQPLWRFLEVESLRPVDRALLIKELSAAVVISYLEASGVLTVVIIALSFWHGGDRIALAILGASLPIQLLSFGMIPWTLSERSSNANVYWIIGIGLPALAIAGVAQFISAGLYPVAIAIVITCAILGIMAIRGGYLLWLAMEFG